MTDWTETNEAFIAAVADLRRTARYNSDIERRLLADWRPEYGEQGDIGHRVYCAQRAIEQRAHDQAVAALGLREGGVVARLYLPSGRELREVEIERLGRPDTFTVLTARPRGARLRRRYQLDSAAALSASPPNVAGDEGMFLTAVGAAGGAA